MTKNPEHIERIERLTRAHMPKLPPATEKYGVCGAERVTVGAARRRIHFESTRTHCRVSSAPDLATPEEDSSRPTTAVTATA